jgi:hypothetical protein
MGKKRKRRMSLTEWAEHRGLRPSRVGVGRTLAVLWLAPDPAAKRKRRRRKAFARKS